MVPFLFLVVVLIVSSLVLLRQYLLRNATYWEDRGVFTIKNDGTSLKSLLQLLKVEKSPVDDDQTMYEALGDKKYGGRFEFGTPMLLVKDLEIVKHILVKDFASFSDRRRFIDTDPLFSRSLFFLRTSEWKDMRAFLSPTFTSGKLRRMYHHFEQSCHALKEYITKKCEKVEDSVGFEVKVRETMQRFTADVIGATAFGMDTDVLRETNSFFFEQGQKSTQLNKTKLFKFGIFSFFPSLGNFFKMQTLEAGLSKFFFQLLRTAILSRENNSSEGREDFLQLLIEAKAENQTEMDFTVDLAIQQAFLFFNAGFDTVADAIGGIAYQLAVHQEIQQKLWEEINEVMTKDTIAYEVVNELKYLDMVVSESLRMYPPLQRLERKCVEDYEVPGSNFNIPKGMMIAIPTDSIHYDEKYYPNPNEFIPERFSTENKANRNPYAYLPFGTGPRNCIGMRFALVEVKVAICHLLHNFQLLPIPGHTPIPMRMWKKFGLTRVRSSLLLNFVPRSDKNSFCVE